jgi:hypothetical protein
MQICSNADLTIKLFDSLETCQSSDDLCYRTDPFSLRQGLQDAELWICALVFLLVQCFDKLIGVHCLSDLRGLR